MSESTSLGKQGSDRNERIAFRWTVGAGVLLLLVLVVVLRSMEHPWEGRTARRLAEGTKLLAEDYLRIYGYWTGVANAALLVVLLIGARWWWKLAQTSGGVAPMGDDHRRGATRWSRRGTVAVLAVILVVAAVIRAPQLERYIMRDEQDALRYTIHGFHELDKRSGEPVFRRVTWTEACFGNPMGNNPILLSVSAKASVALWQRLGGHGEDVFSPVALRMPVFLAGLASIVLIWWATGLLGPNLAGPPALLAAALAAVHPLHIEYSIEARGYGFVLFGAALATGSALNALRLGRWRDWVGMGAGFLISLCAFLGSFYFVVSLGAAVAACLVLKWLKARRADAAASARARASLVRLGVVGVVTLGAYLQVTLPGTMQLLRNETMASFQNALGVDWIFAAYTEMTTGALFVDLVTTMRGEGAAAPVLTMFSSMAKQEPMYSLLVFATLPSLALLGLHRAWRAGLAARLVVCASLVAPLLMYCHHRFGSHRVLMVWYLIFALPVVVMLVALGLHHVAVWSAELVETRSSTLAKVVFPGVVAVFFAWFVWQSGPWFLYRNPQEREAIHPYVNYQRGSRNWVVYPQGISVYFPAGEPAPEEFPWPLPAEQVIDGAFGSAKPRAPRRGSASSR